GERRERRRSETCGAELLQPPVDTRASSSALYPPRRPAIVGRPSMCRVSTGKDKLRRVQMKRKCSASWGFVAAVAAIVSLAATGVVAQSNVTYKAPRTVDG